MKALNYAVALMFATVGTAMVATPVSAACDNYGNQVNVNSDYDCTANYQYCDQGSGAGAGAGAGAGGGASGEAEAGASAGTTTNCTQNNGSSGGNSTSGRVTRLTPNLADYQIVWPGGALPALTLMRAIDLNGLFQAQLA